MRVLLTILLLLTLSRSWGATGVIYYFSTSDGDDSRTSSQAHDPSTPWKTMAKLSALMNAGTIISGDIVRLKSGDVWNLDTLNIIRGITLTSYGSGNQPLISSLYTITSWTNLGNGVYQSEVIPTNIALNMVLINGTPYAMGRYPNANASNGGYLSFEGHSQVSSSNPDTITDNTHDGTLTSAWTGAQLVMKTTLSNISMATITSISGSSNTVIEYSNLSPSATISNNYGYFVQNSLKTLDQTGEWYFDPVTKRIDVYFGAAGPSGFTVKVAARDKLVLAGATNISISNISLQGANYGIFNQVSPLSGLSINNCSFSYFGFDGIAYRGISGSSITNCTINWVNSCGINTWNSNSNVTITGNTITNIGLFPGHTHRDIGANASVGICTASSDTVTVMNNVLNNGGYHGIRFDEANVYLCQYNTLDSFLQVMDDGGSIYCWVSTSPKGALHDRYILNNIITNPIDNIFGTPPGNASYFGGIYCDDRVYNVVIEDNTVSSGNGSGIFLHNAHDITIQDNTLYNNSNGFVSQHDASSSAMNNVIFKRNQVFSNTTTQSLVNLRSNFNDFSTLFSFIDSNYYCRPFKETVVFTRNYFNNNTLNYDLVSPGTPTDWKAFIGGDTHSQKTPVAVTDPNNILFTYTTPPNTLLLDGSYITADNIIYNTGSLSLNSYSSAILIKTSSSIVSPGGTLILYGKKLIF